MASRLFILSFSLSATLGALAGCVGVTEPTAAKTAAAPTLTAAPMPAKPTAPAALKMVDRKVGAGPAVEKDNAVAVHYSGYLWDALAADNKGAKFDSSIERVAPFGFIVGVGRVIAGWDEGVVGMKAGGQRTLVIPADKAYGEKGSPPNIPPGATLLFDIELMSIIGKTQNASALPSPYVPAPKP